MGEHVENPMYARIREAFQHDFPDPRDKDPSLEGPSFTSGKLLRSDEPFSLNTLLIRCQVPDGYLSNPNCWVYIDGTPYQIGSYVYVEGRWYLKIYTSCVKYIHGTIYTYDPQKPMDRYAEVQLTLLDNEVFTVTEVYDGSIRIESL